VDETKREKRREGERDRERKRKKRGRERKSERMSQRSPLWGGQAGSLEHPVAAYNKSEPATKPSTNTRSTPNIQHFHKTTRSTSIKSTVSQNTLFYHTKNWASEGLVKN
jgi:hypothetical protein